MAGRRAVVQELLPHPTVKRSDHRPQDGTLAQIGDDLPLHRERSFTHGHFPAQGMF
jgi:hypothetical protein